MKKLLYLLLLFALLPLQGQIHWLSMEEANLKQQQDPRKFLLFFIDKNCDACNQMLKTTFRSEPIMEFVEKNYYPVLFDVKSSKTLEAFGKTFEGASAGRFKHEFADFLSITSTPSLVFTDGQVMPLSSLQGGLTEKELLPYLSFFSSGDYEKISTKKAWEQKQRKLRSKN